MGPIPTTGEPTWDTELVGGSVRIVKARWARFWDVAVRVSSFSMDREGQYGHRAWQMARGIENYGCPGTCFFFLRFPFLWGGAKAKASKELESLLTTNNNLSTLTITNRGRKWWEVRGCGYGWKRVGRRDGGAVSLQLTERSLGKGVN